MSNFWPQNPSSNGQESASSPSSVTSPTGGLPTSFKTNINRAKTKRWVEAKSYAYDGDDWGDLDEYNEYEGYNEPAPPQRPTGLRQQGQSASTSIKNPHDSYQDGGSSTLYQGRPRNVSGAMKVQEEQQSLLSQTPPNQQAPVGYSDGRTNSFTQQDDYSAFQSDGPLNSSVAGYGDTIPAGNARNQQFSRSYGQQTPPQGPRTYPIGDGNARPRLDDHFRSPSQELPPSGNYRGVGQFRHPGAGSRSQSMTSNASNPDPSTRRDFSAPLATSHPPRKSSLSQQGPPPVLPTSQDPSGSLARNFEPNEDPDSVPRDRSTSIPSKPLPFVRPADIYRRMQEERERERQSQESSRPSMDTLTSGRPGRSGSMEGPSDGGVGSEGLRKATAHRSDFQSGDNTDSRQTARSRLDSVSERRSEYGLDGFPMHAINFDRNSQSQKDDNAILQLPDFTRMSGFGESLMGSIGDKDEQSSIPAQSPPNNPPTQLLAQATAQDSTDGPLQHHPSLGFRSAVHQAFESSEDQIPPTPSSGSAVARSNSESTSGVSPIMSRAPSAATAEAKAREAENREFQTPAIAEEPSEPILSPYGSTLHETPSKSIGKLPKAQNPQEFGDELPPAFIPGHRRDLSTPSPDNSPARTPVVEANRQLRQPQEVELSVTSPTHSSSIDSENSREEMSFVDYASREVDIASAVNSGLPSDSTDAASAVSQSQNSFLASRTPSKELPSTPLGGSSSVPESSRKGKVSDLAARFGGNSRSGSDQSLPSMTSRTGFQALTSNGSVAPRPTADRLESFRPTLPGGWESFTSIAPSVAPIQETVNHNDISKNNVVSPNAYYPSDQPPVASSDPATAQKHQNDNIDINPSTVKRALSKSEPSKSFGRAISAAELDSASSPDAIVSIDANRPSTDLESARDSIKGDEGHNDFRAARGQSASTDRVLQPGAPMTSSPAPDVDTSSGVKTTPSANDGSHISTKDAASNAFPAVEPLRQKPRNEISTDQSLADLPHRRATQTSSTETSPQDFESDRLRREIVQRLSPQISRFNPELSQQSAQRELINPPPDGEAYESAVLPKEYESYWNRSSTEIGSSNRISDQAQGVDKAPSPATVPMESFPDKGNSRDSAAPLTHRFSWEHESGHTDATNQSVPEYDEMAKNAEIGGHNSQIINLQPEQTDLTKNTHVENSIKDLAREDTPKPDSNFALPGHGMGGANQSGSAIPAELLGDSPNYYPAPRDEETPNTDDGHYNQSYNFQNHTSMESPEGYEQHGQTWINNSFSVPHADLPNEAENSMRRNSAILISGLPLSQNQQDQSKLPAFREIVALKTPAERIQTYNETRYRFASEDTGLANWISTMTSQLPEHASLLADLGRSPAPFPGHKTTPSKSKLPGLRLVSGQASQPNAGASPMSAEPGSSLGIPGNSPYGQAQYSGGSGSKISSQQVQAKGKDLLHSAGAFGGKANLAAKGLLSKGKSRFKSSGGVDKASTPTSHSDSFSQERSPQWQDPNHQRNTQSFHSFPNEGLQYNHSANQPNLRTLHPPPKANEATRRSSSTVDGAAQFSTQERDLTGAQNPSVRKVQDVGPHQSSKQTFSQPVPMTKERSIPSSIEPVQPSEDFLGSQNSVSISPFVASSSQTPARLSFQGLSTGRNPGSLSPPQSEAHLRDQYTHGSQSISPPRGLLERGDPPGTPGKISEKHGLSEIDFSVYSKPLDQSGHIASNLVAESERASRSSPSLHRISPLSTDTDSHASTRDEPIVQTVAQNPVPNSSSEETPLTSGGGNAPAQRWDDLGSPMLSESTTRLRVQNQNGHAPSESVPHESAQGLQQEIRSTAKDVLPPPPRPFSFIDYTQAPTQPSSSHQHAQSHSPTNAIGDRRPPSPLSPPYSERDHQHRSSPMYYGTDHDFGPEFAKEISIGHRASFSTTYREPNLHEHPAFRQVTKETEAGEPSSHYRHLDSRGEQTTQPRHQPTEYLTEGVGLPATESTYEKSKSRRSSRGSAFFKGFSGQANADKPPIPNSTERADVGSAAPISTREKKPKRTSLLRALTGFNNDNTQRKNNDGISLPRAQTDIAHQSQTMARQSVESSYPHGTKPEKSRKKLQRASTSGISSQNNEKKRRFSKLGGLFNRSQSGQPVQPSLQPVQVQPESQSPSTKHTGSLTVEQHRSQGQHDQNLTRRSTSQETSLPHHHNTTHYQHQQGLLSPRLSNTYGYIPGHQEIAIPPAEAYQSQVNLEERTFDRPSSSRHSYEHSTRQTPTYNSKPRSDASTSHGTFQQRTESEQPAILNPHNDDFTQCSQTLSSHAQQNQNQSTDFAPNVQPRRDPKASIWASIGKQANHYRAEEDASDQVVRGNYLNRNQEESRTWRQDHQTSPSAGTLSFSRTPTAPATTTTFNDHVTQVPSRNIIPVSSSPPPPPPPPKDDWHISIPRHAYSAYSRSSSDDTTRRDLSDPPHQQQSLSDTNKRPQLPILKIPTNAPPKAVREHSQTSAESRKARQWQIERASSQGGAGPISNMGSKGDSENEEIVMSSSSYPGQEWQPQYAVHWDGE